MTKPLFIRNVCIGEGMPKLIVPIVETTQEAIMDRMAALAKPPIHMVEWRADFFE